jgi:ABC-type multidrug transport system, ATPase component
METPIIQIDNLHKTYKGALHPSVSGLTLSVRKGSFFGLLGPNGAGKTTTLSILCGLRSFDKGTIIINGLLLNKNLPRIKPLIGVVPQDIALYPELTAEENLRFAGNIYALPDKLLNERIEYYLQIFGLMSHRRKKTEYLSGGMKRQVNLIAALLHQPEILILDEPTVGVDVQSRQTIMANLQRLNREGMTIVYTSHNMHEAGQLCSFVSLMNKGKIVCEGIPSELINNEKVTSLEQLFIAKTDIQTIE